MSEIYDPKGQFPAIDKLERLHLGSKGRDVRLLQEWLSLHGHKVSVDGVFGPATADALMVGFGASETTQTVWEALLSPMKLALATPLMRDDVPFFGDVVVRFARQHLASHPREVGGQNRGPWVRLYMDGNEGDAWAWCAGFVTFIHKQAHKSAYWHDDFQAPFRTFSCDRLAEDAKKRGAFITGGQRVGVRPGDIFLVRGKVPGDWVHTGFVWDATSTVIRTIEGNTNDEGHRDGYEACMRYRSYTNLDFVKVRQS